MKGIPSYRILLPIYFLCAAAMTIFLSWLTGFPWYWVSFLTIVLGFLIPLISARSTGETGVGIGIPYLNEAVFYAVNSPRIDIWFAPLVTASGAGIAETFKVCDLTKTTISSWIKGLIIFTPIALVLSFIYLELFWRMAPIPSSTYPAPGIYWPSQIASRMLWVSGKVILGESLQQIIVAAGIGTALYVVSTLAHFPFSIISFAVGMSMPIPSSILMLFSCLLSALMKKRYGDAWQKNRMIIAAGISLGQSLIGGLSAATSMILKSLWMLPF